MVCGNAKVVRPRVLALHINEMEQLERKGTPFMISRGVVPPFVEARMLINHFGDVASK